MTFQESWNAYIPKKVEVVHYDAAKHFYEEGLEDGRQAAIERCAPYMEHKRNCAYIISRDPVAKTASYFPVDDKPCDCELAEILSLLEKEE